MLDTLRNVLETITDFGILFFEYIGVAVILITCVIALFKYVMRKPDTRIYLAKGLAMGLEFKLGSEILRTVVVHQWSEIGIVAGVIALRAALTLLIHWEIKQEEKESEK